MIAGTAFLVGNAAGSACALTGVLAGAAGVCTFVGSLIGGSVALDFFADDIIEANEGVLEICEVF